MNDSKKVLDAIAQAFKRAKMPRVPRELAPLSIDADSVIEHYLGKTQAQLESDFRSALYMEDFSYMAAMGVEYYLPSVLRIMMRLRSPADSELWIYLYGYLRTDRRDGLWWNLRELNRKQLEAIAAWAGFLDEKWRAEAPDYIDREEAAALAEAYRLASLQKK
jgi:hypothetical protein